MAFLPRIIHRRLIVLSIAVLYSGCSDDEQVEPAARLVRAMQISDAPAFSGRSFPGTAEAVDAVEMSFRVGGPLSAFPANELGKKVNKGDLLAQIDVRDFEVRLADAEAALAKAKSELDAMRKARPEEIEKLVAAVDRAEADAKFAHAEHNRNLRLAKTRVASASEVELSEAKAKLADAEVVQAKVSLRIGEIGARPEDIRAKEAEIKSLEAAVKTAENDLADTKLTAPFDGSISAVYVENFEVVQSKQRILRMVNTVELEIRVDIPENLIALVPTVQEAFVSIHTYPDLKIPARIAEIGTEASPTTRTYPVKLRFRPPEGSNIRAGMTGTVSARGDPNALSKSPGRVVPASAVFDREDKNLIWIYDPSSKVVHSRPVEVLGTTPFGLNISGVKGGEWVVTAGVHYLEENQPVRLDSTKTERAPAKPEDAPAKTEDAPAKTTDRPAKKEKVEK